MEIKHYNVKGVKMKRYTLKDISDKKDRFMKAKAICDGMKAYDKDFDKQCDKTNRLRRNYLKIKSLYFGGAN